MSSQSEVMHCYEQMAPLSERMLELARERQWGALPALETQICETVERLKVIEPLSTLDQAQWARKYRLLSRINSAQAETHNILRPQLEHLGQVLHSAEQQRLLRAYCQPQ